MKDVEGSGEQTDQGSGEQMDPGSGGQTDPGSVEQRDPGSGEQMDPGGAEVEDSVATPTQSRSPSVHGVDTGLFDGYPFELDHSAAINDENTPYPSDDQDEGGDVSNPESPISGGVTDQESASANAVKQATEARSVKYPAEVPCEGTKPATECT